MSHPLLPRRRARSAVWRLAALAALAAVTGMPAPAWGQGAAADAVADALRAVEAGAAPELEAALRARLAARPGDRVAALGLASLARLTYAYPRADSLLAALASPTGTPAGAPASGRPDAVAIHARLGRAHALHARGLVGAADAAYADAVRAAVVAGDASALAAAWTGAARARLRTTGVGAADAALDSAERTLPPDRPALVADVRCARALVHATAGRSDADSLALRGLELATRAGARRVAGACHLARAAHFIRLGQMGRAMGDVARADTLFLAARDRAGFADARERRAYINMLLGHYPVVHRYLAEALSVARETDDVGVMARVGFDLADLAIRAGDGREAVAKLDQAETLLATTHDAALPTGRLRGVLHLVARDVEGARRLLAAELARAERMGDWDARRGVLTSIADAAIRGRDWAAADEALAAAERLVADGGATGWVPSLRNARGVLALRRGDVAVAAAHLEARLAALAAQQWVYLAELYTELAHARLLQGDTAAAERLATQASDTLDLYRIGLRGAGGPLRSTADQQARAAFGGESASFERVVAGVAASGRIEGAFRLAERRRARDLADAIATDPRDPGVAGRGDVTPTRSQTAVVRSATEVQRGIDSAYAPFRARLADAAPSLDAVRAALPDARTAVVLFVAGPGGGPTTAFVVTRSGPARSYALPPLDALRPTIERLDALVADGLPGTAPAAALGEALLGPLLRDLPRELRHLVVVPDDALHRVPFALLRVGDADVVDRLAVSTAPSTRVAMSLWARPRSAEPPRILAVGDPAARPDELPDDRERRSVPVSAGDALPTSAMPRLPAARDEAAAASRLGRGSITLLGADATEAAFKRLPLDSFRVIHFAAHAIPRGGSATLLLAPGDGEDGLVSASDVAALRARPELVVLSACRSADGSVLAGEGMQGLATQFIAAGARAVIAARWEVRDAAAGRLMTAVYEELARGRPVDDALRTAQRAARDAGVPARDWAAFVVVGDGSVRFAAERARWGWLGRRVRR